MIKKFLVSTFVVASVSTAIFSPFFDNPPGLSDKQTADLIENNYFQSVHKKILNENHKVIKNQNWIRKENLNNTDLSSVLHFEDLKDPNTSNYDYIRFVAAMTIAYDKADGNEGIDNFTTVINNGNIRNPVVVSKFTELAQNLYSSTDGIEKLESIWHVVPTLNNNSAEHFANANFDSAKNKQSFAALNEIFKNTLFNRDINKLISEYIYLMQEFDSSESQENRLFDYNLTQNLHNNTPYFSFAIRFNSKNLNELTTIANKFNKKNINLNGNPANSDWNNDAKNFFTKDDKENKAKTRTFSNRINSPLGFEGVKTLQSGIGLPGSGNNGNTPNDAIKDYDLYYKYTGTGDNQKLILGDYLKKDDNSNDFITFENIPIWSSKERFADFVNPPNTGKSPLDVALEEKDRVHMVKAILPVVPYREGKKKNPLRPDQWISYKYRFDFKNPNSTNPNEPTKNLFDHLQLGDFQRMYIIKKIADINKDIYKEAKALFYRNGFRIVLKGDANRFRGLIDSDILEKEETKFVLSGGLIAGLTIGILAGTSVVSGLLYILIKKRMIKGKKVKS